MPNQAAKELNCPNGVTAMGTVPTSGRTIACEPSLLGKWLNIPGLGKRRCEDTGGAITAGRIDVYVDSYEEALQFGRKEFVL